VAVAGGVLVIAGGALTLVWAGRVRMARVVGDDADAPLT
jgi:hypothetical protein